jgi:hypothetical protein
MITSKKPKPKLLPISAMISVLDHAKIAIIVESSQRSTSWQVESILNAALSIPAMKEDIQARAFHLIKTDPNHPAARQVLESYGWQPPAESAPTRAAATAAPAAQSEAEREPEQYVQPVFTVADLVPDEDAPRVRVVAVAAGSPGSEATPAIAEVALPQSPTSATPAVLAIQVAPVPTPTSAEAEREPGDVELAELYGSARPARGLIGR